MDTPTGLNHTTNTNKVTVERTYLDALVRRANLHDSTPVDPASIIVSRAEYGNLLRTASDYQALRNALLMGGAHHDTLDILVNSSKIDARKDSLVADEKCVPEKPAAFVTPSNVNERTAFNGHGRAHQSTSWRAVSYGTSMLDATIYPGDENDMTDDNAPATHDFNNAPNSQQRRTLFFSGLSERTTYKDLMSVVKGGKIVSSVMNNNSALVTFATGAADFLAWSKRNDVYLQGKRIEVNWAERQFHVQDHVHEKIARGVTRNILIRNASSRGLTEQRIRDDMEHISQLVIVDIKYRGVNAFVYTNSIGGATFARTCMMSRKEYKGCKIEFFDDECDVIPPQRRATSFVPSSVAAQKKAQKPTLPNRFGLLNTEGTEADSDEENQDPHDDVSDYDDTSYDHSEFGVRLDFLESEG